MHESPLPPPLSVVVPVWRDSEALAGVLALLKDAPQVLEVIVAIAQPEPAALRAAEAQGARCVDAGSPNRGRQLDLGAAQARGEWLLFHHADTVLTPAHLESLAALEKERDVVGGAFYRKFDERHPRLRWLEGVERWHNRSFGALFGDQSIFARRDVFQKLGGYRGLPLLEDVDFSRRLRRAGKIRLLDPPIASSPRKHLTQGPWKTTALNALFLFLYHAGVSPQRLHRWYYRRGAAGAE